MHELNEIIEDIKKTNPKQAKKLQEEIESLNMQNSYGLVFERKDYEEFAVHDKEIEVGDNVKKINDSKSEIYTVTYKDNDILNLEIEKDGEIETLIGVPKQECVSIIRSNEEDYTYSLTPIKRFEGENKEGKENVEHVVINSENILGMKALENDYKGKIDCIFIDPPYNTGETAWKYKDNYNDPSNAYKHSSWLDFMERRLLLAKELLNPENSVLILTIDENEFSNIDLLLKQTFPTSKVQMVTSVVTQPKYSNNGMLGHNNEYVFIVYIGNMKAQYSNYDLFTTFPGEEVKKQEVKYDTLMMSKVALRQDAKSLFYPIFFDLQTGEITRVGEPIDWGVDHTKIVPEEGEGVQWPIHTDGIHGQWRLSPTKLKSMIGTDYLYSYISDRDGRLRVKYITSGIMKEIEKGDVEIDRTVSPFRAYRKFTRKTPVTVWNHHAHQSRYGGTQLAQEIFGDKRFPYPKSLYYVEDSLRFFVADKPNAIILDFFAGSGTTAHAVMRINEEDNGNRRSISITNNEISKQERQDFESKGITAHDKEWKENGIAYNITFPRLKAAIEGKRVLDGKPIKGNYKYTNVFPISDGIKGNTVEMYEVEIKRKEDGK